MDLHSSKPIAPPLIKKKEIVSTVVSDTPVEIFETGTSVTGGPSIPFALYPEDEPG